MKECHLGPEGKGKPCDHGMTCSDPCFRKVTGSRVEGGVDRLKVVGKETS